MHPTIGKMTRAWRELEGLAKKAATESEKNRRIEALKEFERDLNIQADEVNRCIDKLENGDKPRPARLFRLGGA